VKAFILGAVVLLALGCAGVSPSPFPRLGPMSDAETAALLAERSAQVATLYAELTLDYSDPDREGTFEAAVYVRRPHDLRFSAYKDVVITVEQIFDLLITRDAFAIEIASEDDDVPTRESGASREFPERFPQFAGFFWTREGVGLPGVIDGELQLEHGEDGRIRAAASQLSSGANVRWQLEPETLSVEAGLVTAPGPRRYELAYSHYAEVSPGVYLPQRIRFSDPAHELYIEIRVDHVEINPRLEASLFEPGSLTLTESPEGED
jgi:hypothetical protein